jgi:hypothetical protein
MSKKLIAVASAAALALSAFVAVPANAAIVVAFENNGGSSVTPSATASGAAANLDVPANNVLEFTNTATRNSLMKVTVTTVAKDVVSATATGAIKIVDDVEDADGDAYDSNAGASTYTATATTTDVEFYVFTTSTTAGSLTVTKGGNSRTVHFKANPGPAYNLAVTFPTGVPTNGTADVTAKLTDVFGNTAATNASATVLGTGSGYASATSLTWDADDKNWQGTVTGSATAGPVALSYTLANDPDNVDGLAKAVKSAFATLDTASLTEQVKALTSQVAALQAQLEASRPKATSVTKKRYNTLARKWNAANPSARVALKK